MKHMKPEQNPDEYLTPREIIERNPNLVDCFNWDARILGIMFSAKLLNGKIVKSQDKVYIRKSSLVRLINLANAVLAEDQFSSESLDW
jgi:hypothetical protein